MAFTKVTNAGIGSTNTVLLHNLNVVGTVTATDGIFSGIGSFGGNVTIGGTLTYEDVTNVDAVGVITARNGISVLGAGVTIAGGGLNVTAGVSTFGGNIKVGTGITLSPDGDVYITGVSTFSGILKADAGVDASSQTVTVNELNLADSIVHGGDANTKIRFPAADTFTVETAGSEALRVDSSGRVLIGTTTEGAANGDELTIATAANTGITLRSGNTSKGNIYFSDATSGTDEYDGWIQYDHNARALRLATATAEALRIDSSGRVLIGTDTVYSASGGGNMMVSIDKSATSRTDLSISNQNTGDNAGAALVLAAHGQDFILESTGSGNSTTGAGVFTISDSAEERLRISSNGALQMNGGSIQIDGTGEFAVYESDTSLAFTNSAQISLDFSSNVARLRSTASGSGTNRPLALCIGSTERARITTAGNLMIPHNHATGTSPFQHTGWYGDDANHYTLEWTDFNELYALKTHNANDYSSLIYKREYMTQYCDIEFTINGNAPSSGYRHLAFIINGDGSDTSANFDRLVLRQHASDSGNNTTRLDKGGGGHGFTVDSTPNFLDETDHHFHIQIRKRRFTISLDGVRTVDVDTDADLVAAKGYPAFGIYEASTANPWIKIRDFKIRNYTANAKAPSFHAGGNKFIQLSRPSGNTSETFTATDMGMDDNESALIHLVVSGTALQDWGYSFFHWRMPRGSNSEIVTQITPMASGSSVSTFTQAVSGNSLVINKDSDLEVHLTVIGGGGRKAYVGW